MGIVLVAVTLLDLGWAPYRDFLAHAPGLLGGQAFPAFRNPSAVAINFSIPGLVFKLKQLGVPGMGFGAARIVGTLSTLVVAWAILRAARHPGDRRTRSLVWLSILVLATLCSPFLPQGYAAYTPLWLLTLLAIDYRRGLGPNDAVNVDIAALYWHFVDVVWIAIFTLIYLLQ